MNDRSKKRSGDPAQPQKRIRLNANGNSYESGDSFACKQYNKPYQSSPAKPYRFSPINVPSLATKRTTVIYWKQ